MYKELEKERWKEYESNWKREKREALEQLGLKKEDIRRLREEKEVQEVIQKLEDSLLRNRKEERGKSIADSKYNEVYKRIKTMRTPIYLTGKLKMRQWKAEADKAVWKRERNSRTYENTWESR